MKALLLHRIAGALALAGLFAAPARALSPVDLARAVGLDAEAMAIAGLSGAQARDALSTIKTLTPLRDQLQSRMDAADALMARITALRSRLAAGDPSASRAFLRIAENDLAETLAAARSARRTLRLAAMAGCSQSQVDNTEACVTNAAHDVPADLRLLSATTEQWRAVERACYRRDIADTHGTTLDPVSAALLAELDLDPAVIDARINLLTLPAIESAFTLAE